MCWIPGALTLLWVSLTRCLLKQIILAHILRQVDPIWVILTQIQGQSGFVKVLRNLQVH